MRIFSYILFLVTGVFAIFVLFSVFFPSQQDISGANDNTNIIGNSGEDIEQTTPSYDSSVEELESEIDLLRQEIKVLTSQVVVDSSPSSIAPTFQIPEMLKERILQEYTIDTLPAQDVFGFYMFGNLPVSTYAIRNARIYVFGESYSVIRKNIDIAKSIYSFNETNTFFGRSYFLNSILADGVNRFVFEYSGVTIGIEILESDYESFKSLLLEDTEELTDESLILLEESE